MITQPVISYGQNSRFFSKRKQNIEEKKNQPVNAQGLQGKNS